MRVLLAAFALAAAPPYGPPTLQQQWLGHIRSLTRSGPNYLMRFDQVLWLSAATAKQFKREHPSSHMHTGGHIIYDPDHQLYTLIVPVQARAAIVTKTKGKIAERSISIPQLARLVAGEKVLGGKALQPNAPFWIIFQQDTVVEIDQQYVAP